MIWKSFSNIKPRIYLIIFCLRWKTNIKKIFALIFFINLLFEFMILCLLFILYVLYRELKNNENYFLIIIWFLCYVFTYRIFSSTNLYTLFLVIRVWKCLYNISQVLQDYDWRPPSQSELTPIIFNVRLTHLVLEASCWIKLIE